MTGTRTLIQNDHTSNNAFVCTQLIQTNALLVPLHEHLRPPSLNHSRCRPMVRYLWLHLWYDVDKLALVSFVIAIKLHQQYVMVMAM